MILPTLHAASSYLAVSFSVLLVLSLVAVEEIELRRKRDPSGGRSDGVGSTGRP